MQRVSALSCRLLWHSVPFRHAPAAFTTLRLDLGQSSQATRRCMSTGAEGDAFTPTQDHGLLRETVRNFAEAEVDGQAIAYNRDERFNVNLFRKLGDLGLLGVTVPEEYGGAGFDATAACIVHEELSASDPAFCLSYLAHSLLFANNLARNGNEEQKNKLEYPAFALSLAGEKYLPAACSGELIGGMCMSEPGAGTDVFGMRTKADKVDGGSKYVLNGSKMWITNGTLDGETTGDAFLVYAKTGEEGTKQGLSLFLVEKGTEGFRLGQQIKDKCGMRASMTAELVFEDCVIPAHNLVGLEGRAGACMMRNLEVERLGLAAMSCGIARRCVELMVRYSGERRAFGEPLRHFGQIQRLIADSYAAMSAGRALMYQTAQGMELDKEPTVGDNKRVETDAVKLFCGKMGKDAADAAMQVMGGYGYVGEYQVERLWRDSKLLEIGGGTNESHHKNIVRDLSAPANPVIP